MNGEAITAEEIRARRQAVELAKRLLVDSIWRIANIEVSDITYPEAEEIVDGRAPAGMAVDAIVAVNNIKHAWELLLDHVDRPVDWRYVCEYNRILGAGLAWDAGRIREHGVIVGGTQWTLPIPTDESSRERIREIMQESAGGGAAAVRRNRARAVGLRRQQAHRPDGCKPPAHPRWNRHHLDPAESQEPVHDHAAALLRDE